MIDWVFFDVGNVLFNDDPQNFLAYQVVHRLLGEHRPGYTFAEMLAAREALASQENDWILHKLLQQLIAQDDARKIIGEIRNHLVPKYDENHLVNDGVLEVLGELRQRYRLGIIANQPAECRDCLVRRELHEFFDVVAISEELDLHKPDVRLYEWAVKEAACDPSRSVMVGDRLDNDVTPARQLSMKTIQVKWPHSGIKNWRPNDTDAKLFLESCDRTALFGGFVDVPEADCTVGSIREVPAAIASLEGRKPE